MSKLPEECPICGKKMEKGYLSSPMSDVYWTIKKPKLLVGAKKVLSGRFSSIAGAQGEGFRCKDCKIVIFNYDNKK